MCCDTIFIYQYNLFLVNIEFFLCGFLISKRFANKLFCKGRVPKQKCQSMVFDQTPPDPPPAMDRFGPLNVKFVRCFCYVPKHCKCDETDLCNKKMVLPPLQPWI